MRSYRKLRDVSGLLHRGAQAFKGEGGQALPVVLALLTLGGLTVVPTLNYAATSINASRLIEQGDGGLYAAEAGVEKVVWSLQNGVSPPQQLLESINGMQVAMQTENRGEFNLYFDEMVQTGTGHSDYLDVGGNLTWDAGAGANKYTISVTWQPGSGVPTIHLVEVGARLPLGYGYQAGSAALFGNNMSAGEPDQILDSRGAAMLNWKMTTPYPSVSQNNPVKTQAFYLTGSGDQGGDYTWVVANREDVGQVSEISGTLYSVNATATEPAGGKLTGRVAADVLMDGASAYIISWRVLK